MTPSRQRSCSLKFIEVGAVVLKTIVFASIGPNAIKRVLGVWQTQGKGTRWLGTGDTSRRRIRKKKRAETRPKSDLLYGDMRGRKNRRSGGRGVGERNPRVSHGLKTV